MSVASIHLSGSQGVVNCDLVPSPHLANMEDMFMPCVASRRHCCFMSLNNVNTIYDHVGGTFQLTRICDVVRVPARFVRAAVLLGRGVVCAGTRRGEMAGGDERHHPLPRGWRAGGRG